MFADHQPRIGAWARSSADNLCEVIRFAILSAQQPLYLVPDHMKSVHARAPEADGILFAWKAQGWDLAGLHRDTIHWNCMDIWDAYQREEIGEGDAARAMICYLASDVYGLGLAKAGFVAQLAFGLGGCIDTHNLRRFGLKESTFMGFSRLRSAKGRWRKVDQYVTFCETTGGCEYLWDSWCTYVASESRSANAYDDAEHVSRIHCEAFGLA